MKTVEMNKAVGDEVECEDSLNATNMYIYVILFYTPDNCVPVSPLVLPASKTRWQTSICLICVFGNVKKEVLIINSLLIS